MAGESETTDLHSSDVTPSIWGEFVRSLAGDPDAAAQGTVTRWIGSDSRRALVIASMRRVWRESASVDSVDVQRALERSLERLGLGQGDEASGVGRSSRFTQRRVPVLGRRLSRGVPGLGTWASWRILMAGAVGSLAIFAWVTQRAKLSHSEIPYTIATAAGQQMTLRLSEGTRVTLAPRSTLTIQDHDVVLVGEAFFTVPHHSAQPVAVRTGGTVTRVLGTQFDVRRYATDQATRVVVVDGRVSAGRERSVTVSSGSMACVTDSTVTLAPVKSMEPYIAWTRNRLAFSNTPVHEVLDAVGQWYGLQFHVADTTLAAETVTVQLDGQSSSQVLKLLQALLDVTMKVDGHVITLRRRTQSLAIPTRRGVQNSSLSHIQEFGR